MRLESIKISEFRNLKEIEIEGFDKINVIYGLNAQGKTNFVEAIAYLSLLKSFRSDDNLDLINREADFARIEATTSEGDRKQKLKVVINKLSTKTFLGNKEIKKIGDFIGTVNTITFSPEDVFLFKEAPRVRRSFLNNEISKISPAYYLAKNQLSKLLKERNELLKSDKIDMVLLETYNQQLAQLNSEIARKRLEFLNKIEKTASSKYQELSGDDIKIEIEYINQFNGDYQAEHIEKLLMDKFEEDHQKGATQIGVHKDDFVLKLDGKNIAHYGSQGQNRLAALALKLAVIEVNKEKTGSEAIVILDDVLSELDKIKQKRLLDMLEKENQVFITTTQDADVANIAQAKKIKIVQGQAEGES